MAERTRLDFSLAGLSATDLHGPASRRMPFPLESGDGFRQSLRLALGRLRAVSSFGSSYSVADRFVATCGGPGSAVCGRTANPPIAAARWRHLCEPDAQRSRSAAGRAADLPLQPVGRTRPSRQCEFSHPVAPTHAGPAQPFIALSMWSIARACSRCGLNRMTSESLTARTLWPGGQ